MDNLEPITRNEMFLNGDDLEPITREEMILAGADLEPITRHEWFLKKYRGGGDVTIEQLNVTENGTYSESGKAYSPVVVNVPAPPIPENAYLLNNLNGLPADIASFNDGTDLPMASLKVAVTPYQDLSHGDPSPENICPIIGWDEAVVSVSGINVWDEEWEVGALATNDGMPQVSTTTIRSKNFCPCVGGASYYVKCADYTDRYTICVYWYDENEAFILREFKCALSITAPSNAKYFKIVTNSSGTIYGTTYNNDISINYPSTDTSYHAYNGATYTIDLDGTRYGGVLDATNGTMDDMIEHIASYNGETLPSTWISDRDVYAEGTTPTIGAEVVYTRANPITVQLAPTPVKSLEGENNISANCGQITEVKYFKKA